VTRLHPGVPRVECPAIPPAPAHQHPPIAAAPAAQTSPRCERQGGPAGRLHAHRRRELGLHGDPAAPAAAACRAPANAAAQPGHRSHGQCTHIFFVTIIQTIKSCVHLTFFS